MTTVFEERERAFEAKFVHDEEIRFRLAARRDKLFVSWVARRLNLPDEEEARLTSAVLALWGAQGHDRAVIEHVAGVLALHGVPPTGQHLPDVLKECANRAEAQMLVLEA